MIYVLLFQEPPDEMQQIVGKWGDGRHYIMSDRIAFVKEPNGNAAANASTVAEKAGMSPEGKLTGVVLPVRGHYNGWYNAQLWEWLYNAQSNGS